MVRTLPHRTVAKVSFATVFLLMVFIAEVKAQVYDTVKSFYPNGQVYHCTPKLNGRYNGIATSYYPNGELKSKNDWKDGQLVGRLFGYFEDGSVQEKGWYSRGQLVKLKSYYSKGKLKTKYRGTPETNRSKYWNENGQLLQKRRFRHYKLINCSSPLVPDSTLKPTDFTCYHEYTRVYHQNGIYVDENGNPIQSKKCHYKTKEWHPNGQLKSVTIFKKHKLIKKEWDENGTLIHPENE